MKVLKMRSLLCVFAWLTAGVVIAQNYRPEGHAFVSLGGNNLYTRALYGGHTDYRVETSDRPVFAIYKKGGHRNIRFRVGGVAIDSTDYCEARYEDGMRSYTLHDRRWGRKATVRVKVVAGRDAEEAFWRFQMADFGGETRLQAVASGVRKPKLWRNGDIGVDPADAFEADGKAPLQTLSGQVDEVAYVHCSVTALSILKESEGESRFENAEEAMRQLASRIQFSTPDPYINTLGGALVVAADGDWDGQTWLHGCIGWRMPLAGWRAGYLGDVLGWPERAVSHFDAYARSQVKNVPADIPHPTQDSTQNIARAQKRWGTQMYSDGYICRNPNRNDQMHHYDMNLNYIDELLWHFQYDASREYMRKMWPLLKSHLAWEKRNFDPDGDHLYDAYCCIWASDALYYSGGAVTHSSAYNYRGNLLAARIAELIGQDPKPYRREADAILKAMNERLWLPVRGHWAEYQDLMGLRRLHEDAAVWSVYTPIDCGACSPEQAYRATKYVDTEIPHIPVAPTPTLSRGEGSRNAPAADSPQHSTLTPLPSGGAGGGLHTISTSNWMPYSWSINNVAAAEVMHTALAYFLAGRSEEGFQLMKANVLDQMYYGRSPANFGQVSRYDAARGECYRDFGDCIGISARTLVQGLFGIQPEALYERCVLRPGFPESWDSASVHTPYLDYVFRRNGNELIYHVTQRFAQPLKIVLRLNLGMGQYMDVEGNSAPVQVIRVRAPKRLPEVRLYDSYVQPQRIRNFGLDEPVGGIKYRKIELREYYNAPVDTIFRQQYLAPRPPYTTLQIPAQGVGEWCHPKTLPAIYDSVFRQKIVKDEFVVAGVPFHTPQVGDNVVYTSLWQNYPDSVRIPLSTSAQKAWLLMVGSTNHMQTRIANGIVVAHYKDGMADTLQLIPPFNWCPIEQDYFIDGKAFQTVEPRPYRVCLGTGDVSRNLGETLGIRGVEPRLIPGGAAQMLCMTLNPKKKLTGLTIRSLSNDVVIGLMGLTLQ
jgi:hypothetical protein